LLKIISHILTAIDMMCIEILGKEAANEFKTIPASINNIVQRLYQ